MSFYGLGSIKQVLYTLTLPDIWYKNILKNLYLPRDLYILQSSSIVSKELLFKSTFCDLDIKVIIHTDYREFDFCRYFDFDFIIKDKSLYSNILEYLQKPEFNNLYSLIKIKKETLIKINAKFEFLASCFDLLEKFLIEFYNLYKNNLIN